MSQPPEGSVIRCQNLGRNQARRERGYILLILMFFVAALGIASLAVVERISFQMQRDREEELIHRGVQYSRAIRKYFKKFGRYPTRVEDLENTNNVRFLRRRYKDPLNRDPKTGQEMDFKLLHMTDIHVSINPGAASFLPPTAEANVSADQPAQQLNGAPAGAMTPSVPQSTGPGTDSPDQQEQSTGQSATTSSKGSEPRGFATAAGNGQPQVFGGGAIIGVASFSKAKTIREFNKINHYNQWQFIYEPSTDSGGLLMTPNQPPLQGAAQNLQQNGQNGTTNQNPSGFGSSFGSGPNSTPQPPAPQPQSQQ